VSWSRESRPGAITSPISQRTKFTTGERQMQEKHIQTICLVSKKRIARMVQATRQ